MLPTTASSEISSFVCNAKLSIFRYILTGPAMMQHLTLSTFESAPRQAQDEDKLLYPATQRLNVQGGRIKRQPRQHSMLDNRRSAEPSESEPQAQDMLQAVTLSDICEDVLLKTLHNLVVEAVRAEFDLTTPSLRLETCHHSSLTH